MMMMQQQLEETDADQKRDITSLKERLMMGQEAYQELFVNRENLLSELNKLKSRIAICYQKWMHKSAELQLSRVYNDPLLPRAIDWFIDWLIDWLISAMLSVTLFLVVFVVVVVACLCMAACTVHILAWTLITCLKVYMLMMVKC